MNRFVLSIFAVLALLTLSSVVPATDKELSPYPEFIELGKDFIFVITEVVPPSEPKKRTLPDGSTELTMPLGYKGSVSGCFAVKIKDHWVPVHLDTAGGIELLNGE